MEVGANADVPYMSMKSGIQREGSDRNVIDEYR
jgi:hypothetical protein